MTTRDLCMVFKGKWAEASPPFLIVSCRPEPCLCFFSQIPPVIHLAITTYYRYLLASITTGLLLQLHAFVRHAREMMISMSRLVHRYADLFKFRCHRRHSQAYCLHGGAAAAGT